MTRALRRRYGHAKAGLRLWRYNAVTGLWRVEREVTPETAQEWLQRFKRDEPAVLFMVSLKKPSEESGRTWHAARAGGQEWESAPIGAMRVVLRDEFEPFSKTRRAWRAYRVEGTERWPLGIGEETRSAAARRVLAAYPQAVIEVE